MKMKVWLDQGESPHMHWPKHSRAFPLMLTWSMHLLAVSLFVTLYCLMWRTLFVSRATRIMRIMVTCKIKRQHKILHSLDYQWLRKLTRCSDQENNHHIWLPTSFSISFKLCCEFWDDVMIDFKAFVLIYTVGLLAFLVASLGF